MKMKRLALLMLCAVMILTSAVIPTVFTAKAAEPINDYNYSNPASDRNLTLTAAEFLTDLGYTLSDAEADYLNAFCDFKFLCTESFPHHRALPSSATKGDLNSIS